MLKNPLAFCSFCNKQGPMGGSKPHTPSASKMLFSTECEVFRNVLYGFLPISFAQPALFFCTAWPFAQQGHGGKEHFLRVWYPKEIRILPVFRFYDRAVNILSWPQSTRGLQLIPTPPQLIQGGGGVYLLPLSSSVLLLSLYKEQHPR